MKTRGQSVPPLMTIPAQRLAQTPSVPTLRTIPAQRFATPTYRVTDVVGCQLDGAAE